MQKIIISASLLVSLLFGVQMGFAQNITDGDPSNDVCVNLQTSVFRYKSSDMTTNGEVSDLQDFLIAKGMLSGTPTGFYGRLTVAAVKTYQRSLGVSPTGNVGSLTKSLIQKETCTGESQPITDPVVISPIPGMKTITYYYINDAHTACGRGTLITNIGLVNGEYVYKPGQYKTESECKTTNGLPSIPTGIMCTMEVKLCPDGSAMQRDPNCSWRSDKCAVSTIYSRPSITNVVTSLSGDILTATIYGYNLEKVNNVSEERKVDGTRYITPSSVDYGKVTVVLSTRGAYNGISTFKVYSQNGAVESNMMSITLPEVSSIIPKVSSVTLENNTANDGSKILRVNGSNLDYTGTVVVNGCSFYYNIIKKTELNFFYFFNYFC